jgi:tRNA (guanine-N7-)-methyltransferase
LAVVRVRQHVNPLSQKYQEPIAPPDWEKVYADITRPFHLDIGCGRGYFLLEMAQQQPDWNFLGLEIREPLVQQANEWQSELGLTNLHYIFCNVNQALPQLFASMPAMQLQCITIQFPDPWFKKRHQKRRVVQPEMIEVLAKQLVPSGTVFLQSDVEAVAIEMSDRVQAHPAFIKGHCERWLSTNPFPVSTERERSTLDRGGQVYRTLFIRR